MIRSKFKPVFISIIALVLTVLLVLFLFYIKPSEGREIFNTDFYLAVIETTEQANKSNITFYNKDLIAVGTREIKLGSMGSSFDLPRIYGKNMYVIPKGIGNQKDLTVIMEYDMESGKYETYDMKRVHAKVVRESEPRVG